MPRAANVIADRRTTCLYMSKEMFEQNLGSLQEIIDKDRKSECRAASNPNPRGTPPLPARALHQSLDHR